MTEPTDPGDPRDQTQPHEDREAVESAQEGQAKEESQVAGEPEPDEHAAADEPPRPGPRRPRLSGGLRTGIPVLAILVLLAIASFVPGVNLVSGGSADAPGRDLQAVISRLPAGAPVVVDIDADLGTYPEIRYATRAALASLMRQGADLAIVSFSGEGRAIAAAEIARLRDLGAGPDRLLDLGFRSGGEPALVQLAGSGIGPRATGPLADALRKNGPGSFRLALVIGGAEIGPRSWVEQVQPRLPNIPIAGITPSFLLPEVLPYRSSGQLAALLGTLPADVAFGQQVAAGAGPAFGPGIFAERGPSGAAIVLGMLVAIAVLLAASGGSLAGWARAVVRAWRS
jgi:hypothetical protein